jgi:uncharacterized membrane protein required for colicin V production
MKIINWFDILVVLLLIVGIFHGRKRGMSLELLPLLQMLIIVVGGSLVYAPIGRKLAEWTNGTMTLLVSFICAYLLVGIVTYMIFSNIKRAVGEKLVGGDIFGSMEYYFGMVAGMLRYACYILVGLALLHAKPIDYETEKAYRKTEKDNLGNITFPTYTSIQSAVFDKSEVGTLTRKHAAHLLISATAPNSKAKKSQPIAKKREQAIDDLISGKTTAPAPEKAQ